jgi:type II secretory pathway pseudopilin PulG
MQLRLKKLSEAGDTLVEVLVSIGVLSLILGGAFILTNRSLQSARSSQERLNATKLVESQLEQLKNLAANNPDLIFGATTPASFCIDQSGAVKASSNAACKVGPSGAATTAEPAFNLSVTRAVNTFTVKNSWNSATGRTIETAEMSYRLYE